MKLLNLLTYKEYINKHKGYKQVGQRHYYQYCQMMDDYIGMVRIKRKLINDIEANTKYANNYYKINVNPNFGV
jgi:hypothetical protein